MKPLTSPEVVIGREHPGKARVSRLFHDLRREWLKAYTPGGPKGIIPEADEALLAAQTEAEAKAVALTQYWQERGRLERGVLLSTTGLPHMIQAIGKTKPKDTGVVDWELTAFS